MKEAKSKTIQPDSQQRPKSNKVVEYVKDFFNKPVFLSLFAVNLVFLLVFGSVFKNHIDPNFMLNPSNVWDRPWTVVTSAFMHAGILHFLINMIALNSFLKLDVYSAKKDLNKNLIIVYILSIFSSALFIILFSTSDLPTVGASGAIFGIFGAMLTYYRYAKDRLALFITLLINMVITFAIPNVSWQAHLGGLFMGVICGLVMNYIEFKRFYPKSFVQNIQKNSNPFKLFEYDMDRKVFLFFNSKAEDILESVEIIRRETHERTAKTSGEEYAYNESLANVAVYYPNILKYIHNNSLRNSIEARAAEILQELKDSEIAIVHIKNWSRNMSLYKIEEFNQSVLKRKNAK